MEQAVKPIYQPKLTDEQRIKRGFWEGIALLCAGAFLGGMCVAQHWWLQAFVCLFITVPFSAWGLKSNHESYMLHGRIEEIEKQIED